MIEFLTGILGSIFDGIQRPLKVWLSAAESVLYIFICEQTEISVHSTYFSYRGDNKQQTLI